MKLIFALMLTLFLGKYSKATDKIELPQSIILIQAHDLEKGLERTWKFDQNMLKVKSTWGGNKAPSLGMIEALNLARRVVGNVDLEYIEFRRPLDKCENVFFYFISFEREDVVILLDGEIVLPTEVKN